MTGNEAIEKPAGPIPSECRALIVLPAAAGGRKGDAPDDGPLAEFLTHLIACRNRLPAFRRAGRAEPAVARRIYGGQVAHAPRRLDLVV